MIKLICDGCKKEQMIKNEEDFKFNNFELEVNAEFVRGGCKLNLCESCQQELQRNLKNTIQEFIKEI